MKSAGGLTTVLREALAITAPPNMPYGNLELRLGGNVFRDVHVLKDRNFGDD